MDRRDALLTLAAGPAALGVAPAAGPAEPDLFAHLVEANRAQVVMLAERGLVPPATAGQVAAALRTAAAEQDAPGAARSANYLDLEARLVELAGPAASDLHLGRSRNDLGETVNRMVVRRRLLGLADALGAARGHLHRLADAHRETVIPGYTHAVQAQPTTLAHLLLAFDAAAQRDSDRLRQAYARADRSPLGSGAFTTSGFPLDRDRLAALLGFSGLVENAYDAIMVAAADYKVEVAGVAGQAALTVGRFAQYLLFQYADPVPGLALAGPLTGRSSAMPQKRNPSGLERLRLAASEVLANAHAAALFAHNTPLYEVKDVREDHLLRTDRFLTQATDLFVQLGKLLAGLEVRPAVLRAQVDRDYSTMTELAEVLHRAAGVPFRVGHAVASDLTTYGRDRGKRPLDLTRDEVEAVYRKATGKPLPLTAEQVRAAFDPLAVVRSRKGKGGPQPAETARMLADQRAAAAEAATWAAGERTRLAAAAADLRRRFDRLADGG